MSLKSRAKKPTRLKKRQSPQISRCFSRTPTKLEVWEQFKSLKPDLQVMAFVTLFVFLERTDARSIKSPFPAAALSWSVGQSTGRSSRAGKKPGCRSSGPIMGSIPAPSWFRRENPDLRQGYARYRVFWTGWPRNRRDRWSRSISVPRTAARRRASSKTKRKQLRRPLRSGQRAYGFWQTVGADRPLDPRLQSRTRRRRRH